MTRLLILSIATGLTIGWAAKQVRLLREMAIAAPETASTLVFVERKGPATVWHRPDQLQRPSVQLRPVRPVLSLPAAAPGVEKSGDSIKFEF